MLVLMSNSLLCSPDPQGWQGTCPASSWALQQAVLWYLSNWVQSKEQLLPQHAENELQDGKAASALLLGNSSHGFWWNYMIFMSQVIYSGLSSALQAMAVLAVLGFATASVRAEGTKGLPSLSPSPFGLPPFIQGPIFSSPRAISRCPSNAKFPLFSSSPHLCIAQPWVKSRPTCRPAFQPSLGLAWSPWMLSSAQNWSCPCSLLAVQLLSWGEKGSGCQAQICPACHMENICGSLLSTAAAIFPHDGLPFLWPRISPVLAHCPTPQWKEKWSQMFSLLSSYSRAWNLHRSILKLRGKSLSSTDFFVLFCLSWNKNTLMYSSEGKAALQTYCVKLSLP